MKLQRLAVEKVETGRSAILKEVQADFDRYLRNFVKDSDLLKKTKKSYQVNDDWEIRAFQSRWADFLINEPEDSDDLRPTLGLDRHVVGGSLQRISSGILKHHCHRRHYQHRHRHHRRHYHHH